jgi:hypothetical protein
MLFLNDLRMKMDRIHAPLESSQRELSNELQKSIFYRFLHEIESVVVNACKYQFLGQVRQPSTLRGTKALFHSRLHGHLHIVGKLIT